MKPGKNEVTFPSQGMNISAHLFVPTKYINGVKYPGIVLTRPGGGVKEQTAGLYAEKLSQHGFVTLAFDPRGFGGSEGREQAEDPYNITEDTRTAVSYLRTLSVVDKEKIFNVGICAGAGYAGYATALDSRIKAVAMISPFFCANDMYAELVGGVSNLRKTLLPMYAEAHQKLFETGEDTYNFLIPSTEEEKATSAEIQLMSSSYYMPGGVGNVPTWKNKISLVSLEKQLAFSVFNVIDLLKDVPIFMAWGSEAPSRKNNASFFDKLPSENKKKLVVPGEGHFELYWKPELVDSVAQNIAIFFKVNSD